jgi:hypothetical protein
METFILHERVLTDNLLLIPNKGTKFKGGFIGAVKEHYFKNEWTDEVKIIHFKKYEILEKYLQKKYPDFDIDLIYNY